MQKLLCSLMILTILQHLNYDLKLPKYTPLGPWIRRFGGGGTNSMNAMDTFSSYTEETSNMLSDESANYISYQPM
ncbi:PIR protein, fragment [Plasmodium vivax]|uniref:VIR protein n=1 Tax=Plasmodium vivax TaxID=5855 RepID=A0A565A4X3_PLAVI|nr:PIR protein, fragment [Plasmodium vivax]